MSDNEELWLDPGHEDPDRAATELASCLNMRLVRDRKRWVVIADHLSDAWPEVVRGPVELNDTRRYAGEKWPEDFSVYTHLPLVWTVEAPFVRDRDGLERCARELFDRVAATLPWSIALTRRMTELVATYHPEHGVREFPPGTPADGTGRHLWAPGSV